jgi:hypothetical protein
MVHIRALILCTRERERHVVMTIDGVIHRDLREVETR